MMEGKEKKIVLRKAKNLWKINSLSVGNSDIRASLVKAISLIKLIASSLNSTADEIYAYDRFVCMLLLSTYFS